MNLRDPCDQYCFFSNCNDNLFKNNDGQSKNHILTIGESPFFLESDGGTNYMPGSIPPWFCRTGDCDRQTVTIFDLGASYFNSGLLSTDTNAQAGGWLHEKYNFLQFKNYYAFEYEKLDTVEVFNQIPTSMMGIYHWINVPVSADKGGKTNPWTILRSISYGTSYTDLTIVKLDIDTPLIENALIDQLFEERLGSHIDEFYYEHHVANFR